MEYNFDKIKDTIKQFQCEKRYKHTLGVANEAYELAKIYIPEKANKLKLAGYLHDISKDFSFEMQIKLCEKYSIDVDISEIAPKLLHSKTGCHFAREIFGNEIVDDEIFNAILFHTTGRANMSLFVALLYLADYIEKGRTFIDCVTLRQFFYSGLENCCTYTEKIDILVKTLLLSYDLTIKNLIDEGKRIDFETIKARNYYLSDTKFFI